MKKKGTAAVLLAAMIVLTLPTAAFSDMAGYAWCESDVAYLNERDLLRGTTADTFSPGAAVTRGDFALLAVRVFGLDADYILDNFADVTSNLYFYKAVGILKMYHIVTGVDGQHYCPETQIMRQDMAVMLWRLMNRLGYYGEDDAEELLHTYWDSGQIEAYAREAIAYMIEKGIMKGKDDGRISPRDTVTRAEMAVMMARIHRHLEQSYGN